MKNKIICSLLILLSLTKYSNASDGYDLWLGYHKINNASLKTNYKKIFSSIYLKDVQKNATIAVIKKELTLASKLMFEAAPLFTTDSNNAGILFRIDEQNKDINEEGYGIKAWTKNNKNGVTVYAKNEVGLLYGCFALIRSMQMQEDLKTINTISSPTLKIRMLNHWDNINRTIERGYAGNSIFNWHTLPDYIDKRYIDYARANASIGINGTVVTNVNANALFLTPEYLLKVNTCICNAIVNELPLAQPTISQHLKELKNAGIIKGNSEGNAICYCINEPVFSKIQGLFRPILSTQNKCC